MVLWFEETKMVETKQVSNHFTPNYFLHLFTSFTPIGSEQDPVDDLKRQKHVGFRRFEGAKQRLV